jgi:NADPH:quinone reductase-like Zn-dependent oxidoreductase
MYALHIEVNQMKAVVLHEYGGPEKLKYEDVADPVAGEGQLLVRLSSTSVNPIDYKLRSGAMAQFMPIQFPFIPGNDISGIVRQVGPGVQGFQPGDRIIALGSSAYAELAAVPAATATLIPGQMDVIEAAALPLVTQTGENLVSRGTKIQKGQTVLISGAVGGVGRSAVLTAKKAGAVVIAGVKKSQLDEAKTIGADQLLALDDSAAMAKLGFVDAVANTIAGPTAEMLIGKVKQGGVFATVVGPPANAGLHPTVRVEAIQVQASGDLLRSMAEEVLAGRLVIPVDRMIPLSDAAAGQAAAEKGGIGKVLLLM